VASLRSIFIIVLSVLIFIGFLVWCSENEARNSVAQQGNTNLTSNSLYILDGHGVVRILKSPSPYDLPTMTATATISPTLPPGASATPSPTSTISPPMTPTPTESVGPTLVPTDSPLKKVFVLRGIVLSHEEPDSNRFVIIGVSPAGSIIGYTSAIRRTNANGEFNYGTLTAFSNASFNLQVFGQSTTKQTFTFDQITEPEMFVELTSTN